MARGWGRKRAGCTVPCVLAHSQGLGFPLGEVLMPCLHALPARPHLQVSRRSLSGTRHMTCVTEMTLCYGVASVAALCYRGPAGVRPELGVGTQSNTRLSCPLGAGETSPSA